MKMKCILYGRRFEDLDCSALRCGYYEGNVKSKRCQEKGRFVYHRTEPDKECPLMGDMTKVDEK